MVDLDDSVDGDQDDGAPLSPPEGTALTSAERTHVGATTIARETLASTIAVGCTVALVYGLTLARSLTWSHWGSDGGDFVTAAVTGRVPHPPGFPVYLALSRLAVRVFTTTDPAWVLNLLSAVAAGGTALLVAAAARRRGASVWAAAAAALALAFSPWLWSQALITEVYATAALLVGLLLWLCEWAQARGGWWWGLVGLGLGLAVSTHVSTIFLVPYIAARSWRDSPRVLPGLAVGLLPYVVLPLAGPWPQPWGDLRSMAGWLHFVSARFYWGNAFGLPAALWPSRTLAWVVLSLRQFTPVGALLLMVGATRVMGGRSNEGAMDARGWHQGIARWLRWVRSEPSAREVLGGGLSLGLVSLYAIGYDAADSWVYLVAYLPLGALYVAGGIDAVADSGVPVAAGLLLPLALVVLNGRALNLAHDQEATVWLERTLLRLPDRAIVLTADDRHTFALWYAVDALGRRRDLLVVDERLLGFEPYDEFLRREGADGAVWDDVDAVGFAGERPVCAVDVEGEVRCP